MFDISRCCERLSDAGYEGDKLSKLFLASVYSWDAGGELAYPTAS
jgi:hypothetical protein